MQVLGLVGAAATHGAALDLDRHVLGHVGTIDYVLDIGIVQAQVDGVVVERGGGSLLVQGRQQRLRGGDRRLRAGDAEDVAAVGDLHAELEFDLAQVRVERAGQIGQALDVVGFQGEVAMCR